MAAAIAAVAVRRLRVRKRPDATRIIRPGPSRWSCPILPAAASTRWRASWPTSCRARSGSRSWSTTAPAAPGWSAPAPSSRARPTAIRCSSAIPARSRSIRRLYANAGFDPRKDFAPIGLIASMPVALLAHPSFPAKTVTDVIAIAKKEGEQVQHRHVGGRHRQLSFGRVVQVGHRRQRGHHSLQGHRRSS